MFSEDQKVFLINIGLNVNCDYLSDEDYFTIEEKVSDYLQRNGFDKDYNPTKEGLMCESILDDLPV